MVGLEGLISNLTNLEARTSSIDLSDASLEERNSVKPPSREAGMVGLERQSSKQISLEPRQALLEPSDVLRSAQNSVSERSSANDMVGPPGLEPGTNGL